MNREEMLAERADLIRACRDCPLGHSRTNAVPGKGPADARVVLIAEGPGQKEDESGEPFMGPAGDFLDDLLPLADLGRDEIFITNMIRCQAPGNRDPRPEELEACDKHLEAQLEIIRPDLIVALGRFSLAKFLPDEKAIGQARGVLKQKQGRFIYPVMHPAAGLRRNEFRDRVIEDFLGIPEALRMVREDPPEEEMDPGEETTQNSLF